MLVMRDYERLYLSSWNYNAARIMTRLASRIEDAGGTVKPLHPAIISNRHLDQKIYDLTERAENYRKFAEKHPEHKELSEKAIKAIEEEIKEAEAQQEEPIRVTHTTYISAKLDGKYISVSLDDNPFFDFRLIKTPLRNNGTQYSQDAASEEFTKEWLYDCFLTGSANDEEIKEAAEMILNAIQSAPDSKIIRGYHFERVQNRYNDGWHKEKILDRERIGKIDW